MYQVLCDGYPLMDWRDNDLILVNPKAKLAVNKVGEASFTLYKNHPHYDKLKRSRSVFEIADEIGVIFRGRMTGDTIDFDNGKAVDLEGAMAYFNDSVVRPYSFPADFLEDPEYIAASKSGNVIQFFLKWLIDNHNEQVQEFQRFKLGNVTVTDPNNYLYRQGKKYANTWETLQADLFKSALGGYLCIRYEADGNYIDYLSEFDQTNTQEIVFGENLTDLKNETDSSATYSAIIPLGAENEQTVSAGTVEGESVDFELSKTVKGQLDISGLPDGNVAEDIVKKGDTLYSVSAVNQIGWIYAPTSETTWDDVTRAENLLLKGIEWLQTNGMMSSNTIEVTAVDLHFSDAEISSFRLYRNINVRSAPHDVVSTYPLSELDIDLLNPQNTKITVGESRLTLIDKQYSENTNAADKIVDMNNQGTLVGIANVKTLYYLSTSGEELTGGEWVTEEPTRTEGTYIWTKSVILYSDKSTYESPPSCSTGAKGDTGIGVDLIETEFYLSDSDTELTGGEWVTAQPKWAEGKYLWIRSVVYYSDGSTSYTAPICDTTWEAVNNLDELLDQEEVFNRLTQNGSLQGLYMEDDNLYINATYINSGILKGIKIIGESGTIGGFSMSTGTLTTTFRKDYPTFTQADLDKMTAYYLGTGELTDEEIDKYDVNMNGRIDAGDAIIIRQMMNGLLPKYSVGQFTLNASDPKNTMVLEITEGYRAGEKTVIGLGGINSSAIYVDSSSSSALPLQVSTAEELEPDIYRVFGEVSSLDVKLIEVNDGKAHEYCFEFIPTADFTHLHITPSPTWTIAPQFTAGKPHQVSILRGIGVILSA